ncbi:MAG: Lrp/AsnC family transcriptional regulator [Candidatus Acidulodesulfobacterium ferriphilum]|uniref:siroheme decarboxylase n=1 Tax=Candidatus Acidulodesulfobacterium ferriphilum TaxID=2597223 RepID=A0A519BB44_9DELT|nr:MAG: Lrp/AsnC family transcriptional regulator [Candidatus Acidulodesulfobacterium ferriphilum]
MEFELTDKKILNILQTDFPISARPFLDIAGAIGITEQEVIDRILNLKKIKVIRQISAIFDSHNIGYKSTLAAFKVSEGSVDFAANIINSHNGVSHNYLRSNEYNIWFTITLPAELDLEEEIKVLSKESNASDYLILPTLKLFKIGVNFDMTGEDNASFKFFSHDDFKDDVDINVSDFEKCCIKELQKDLEITPEPFKNSSVYLGISQDKLLNQVKDFISEKKMRRFACVLYHQKAGFSYNIMGIWKSKPEDVDKNGKLMSSVKEVSHCYQRPVYPGRWEYNIFTMIHAKSKEEAFKIMKDISALTGINDFDALESVREFKKVRVKYYV